MNEMKIDYQNNDYDFLQSFYGIKEAFPIIENAAKAGVFRGIAENRPLEEIKSLLSADPMESELLLDILEQAGLILRGKDYICTAPVGEKYLTDGNFLSTEKKDAFTRQQFLQFFPEGLSPLECSSFADAQCHWEKMTEDDILAFCGCFQGDYTLAAAVETYALWQRTGVDRRLSFDEVKAFCKEKGLVCTPLLSVTDGISVVFGAKNEAALEKLLLTKEARLAGALKKLDIVSLTPIDPKEVVASSWVKDHCRFGCATFGSKHCPPHSPNYDETGTRLSEYQKAFLIEGAPPTRSFQKLMLRAEHIAFKSGFYRAFAYWAGPCSLCTECNPPAPPKKCTATRPSMESAGIDVFATVRKQGFTLETRQSENDFVKYFGLLLLD